MTYATSVLFFRVLKSFSAPGKIPRNTNLFMTQQRAIVEQTDNAIVLLLMVLNFPWEATRRHSE
jgi:hypothetical protein